MVETIFMSSKQLKKQPSGNYYTRTNFMSRPNDLNIIHAGLLFPPTIPLNFSGPFHGSYQEPQPPLLPLPPPKSLHASLPCRTQNLSSPTTNRSKINRNLTPKKQKSKKMMMSDKGEERKKDDSKALVIESIGPLGPDPKDLPRHIVSRVFSASPSMVKASLPQDLNEFSDSVFTLAPPPSSLPLPNFSLRPKGGCNAQVAKVDAGATDDVRRLLHLH